MQSAMHPLSQKNQDAYVIRQRHPDYANIIREPIPNTDATFFLQKYHYEPALKAYIPKFRREAQLNLRISDYRPANDGNYDLPYFINAYPYTRFTTTICSYTEDDPILRMLHPDYRMVFRYNPDQDFGVLLHYGYDFDRIDDAPQRYLWISALNRYEL